MEKYQDNIQQQMSIEQYEAMSIKLNKNKKEMLRILEECPKVGAYLNQTREDFDHFFTFFMNFLRSQIGPRGQCAKLIRNQLKEIQDQVNKALLPFGQNARTHIRQIYMKHKYFVPCKEYTQLLKIDQANIKFKSNLDRLNDRESPMTKSITQGLRAKHGDQYNFQEQIEKLKCNYITKIEQAEQQINVLKQILNKTEAYHQYINVKHLLAPYFKQWIEADSNMGKENVKTGQQFQQKVKDIMIPYLIYRERSHPNWIYNNKKIEIFINASWIPKNLGQIDIAFGYKDQVTNRYFIFTLIQCKSRLFDLREAYKQVSLDDQQPLNKGPTLQQLKQIKKQKQRLIKKAIHQKNTPLKVEEKLNLIENGQKVEVEQKQKEETKINNFVVNKKFLSTKYGPAQLVDDHHFYIITTLPQNEFILPIQSKMKQSIERYTKNLFIEDIQSQALYKTVRQRFENVGSPLDWFKRYEKGFTGEESNILVLN